MKNIECRMRNTVFLHLLHSLFYIRILCDHFRERWSFATRLSRLPRNSACDNGDSRVADAFCTRFADSVVSDGLDRNAGIADCSESRSMNSCNFGKVLDPRVDCPRNRV
jgi:hypothetical protein